MAASETRSQMDDSAELNKAAISLWDSKSINLERSEPSDPILPVLGQRNVLVTGSFPLLSDVPHLGDLLSSILSADVFNRYCRQKGYNTLFVYGVNDSKGREKERDELTFSKDMCDEYFQMHTKLYKWLNVKFNVFGRTNDNQLHTKLASLTCAYTDEWEKWCKKGSGLEVEFYYFMRKDMSSPDVETSQSSEYMTPTCTSVIENLLYEEGHFSKSQSIGLYGNDAMTTGIPADLYRFYLLFIRPENKVTSFNWSSFALTVNTELINNIGTFINRTLIFIEENYNSTVPDCNSLTEKDTSLFVTINSELKEYFNFMESQRLQEGLKSILKISRSASQYVQSQEPWKIIRTNNERTRTVINISVNIVYVLGVLLGPYTPSVSRDILQQLKVPPNWTSIPNHFTQYITSGHKIGEPRPLFMTLDNSRISLLKDMYSGRY